MLLASICKCVSIISIAIGTLDHAGAATVMRSPIWELSNSGPALKPPCCLSVAALSRNKDPKYCAEVKSGTLSEPPFCVENEVGTVIPLAFMLTKSCKVKLLDAP